MPSACLMHRGLEPRRVGARGVRSVGLPRPTTEEACVGTPTTGKGQSPLTTKDMPGFPYSERCCRAFALTKETPGLLGSLWARQPCTAGAHLEHIRPCDWVVPPPEVSELQRLRPASEDANTLLHSVERGSARTDRACAGLVGPCRSGPVPVRASAGPGRCRSGAGLRVAVAAPCLATAIAPAVSEWFARPRWESVPAQMWQQ